MIRDPIRRRFGFGAARLRMGLPAESERLSERARTRLRLERRLTLVPFVTAGLILFLLSTVPASNRFEATGSEILVDAWTPTREVALARAEESPPVPRIVESTRPARRSASRVQPARAPTSTTPPRNDPSDANVEPRAFDVAALATRGAVYAESAEFAIDSPAGALPDSVNDPGRLRDPQRAREAASKTIPTGLAVATRAPVLPVLARGRPLDTERAADALAATGSGARAARPSDAIASRGSERALAAAASAGTNARREALADLERETAAGRGRTSGRSRDEVGDARRPAVSAPLPDRSRLDTGSSGGELGGWEEVPLDALPDCDPPGRQDLLKKRILLAVPGRRECAHASGSFRFVETRSLGAFLMWSRPKPAALTGSTRDRDACDVLERALACLGVP